MLKLLTLVTLCVAVVLLERAAAGDDYTIEKNPPGYGSKLMYLTSLLYVYTKQLCVKISIYSQLDRAIV